MAVQWAAAYSENRNGTVLSVEGNTCKRGAIYGKKEVTDPTRIVTTTVHVSGGVENMVSVKTQSDIPKDKIFDCIHALKILLFLHLCISEM